MGRKPLGVGVVGEQPESRQRPKALEVALSLGLGLGLEVRRRKELRVVITGMQSEIFFYS